MQQAYIKLEEKQSSPVQHSTAQHSTARPPASMLRKTRSTSTCVAVPDAVQFWQQVLGHQCGVPGRGPTPARQDCAILFHTKEPINSKGVATAGHKRHG